MNYKIVADTSANIFSLEGVPFGYASMKICTDEAEYTDAPELDVKKMTDDLASYKGKSGTSCPSVSDWLDSFGEAERIFCITITSKLSGSYNSACLAKNEYEEKYPDRKVFVIDTFSAGPKLKIMAEKLQELILSGLSYEEICEKIMEYNEKTEIIFVLESMTNLANNGRISGVSAKLAGILGIRVVGKATDGVLEPLDKVRGEKKTIACILERLQNMGYKGGRLSISHCFNLPFAEAVSESISGLYPDAVLDIHQTTALCSFYAEKGGIILGFEK